jgi:hypothetical protein
MAIVLALHTGTATVTALAASAAFAEDAAPPVEVFVAAPPETCARLEQALGVSAHAIRWFRTEAIDPARVLEPPPGAEPAGTARVWIDGSRSDRLRLYFANWTTERFLTRDVPLPGGLDEVALETVAQLVESAIAALRTEAPFGLTRAEMTAALRPAAESRAAPVAAVRKTTFGPSVGAFYALQAFSTAPPLDQGPGVVARLEWRSGRWHEGVWLSAQYQLPLRIESTLASARLDTVAVRSGAAIGRATSESTTVDLELGAGADLVHIAPRAGTGNVAATLSADRFSWAYAVQIGLALTGEAGPHVAVSTALLADIGLDAKHYDVVVDGALARVATPWRVRPGVRLGVAWR